MAPIASNGVNLLGLLQNPLLVSHAKLIFLGKYVRIMGIFRPNGREILPDDLGFGDRKHKGEFDGRNGLAPFVQNQQAGALLCGVGGDGREVVAAVDGEDDAADKLVVGGIVDIGDSALEFSEICWVLSRRKSLTSGSPHKKGAAELLHELKFRA